MVDMDYGSLINQLGLKFFIPFLLGMALGYIGTKKVFISLAAGLAVGAVGWLIL